MRRRSVWFGRGILITLLAGMSLSAQAVFLNPQGLGQVLVYPYYTVNGGQDTLLALVNMSADAKAVKVRFLEGYNSRDVLDVNVYLAAGDVWTAAVTDDGEGARLLVHDESCTVPAIESTPEHSVAFTTRAFDGRAPTGKDGGPVGISRTREGHIEVIEMGVVKPNTASAYALSPVGFDYGNGSGEWQGGQPSDCARLRSAWDGAGYWNADPAVDLAPPTGGLSGSVVIVDVARGVVQGYVADALAEFHEPGKGIDHTPPDALTPNIASGTSLSGLVYPSGHALQATFTRGIDAVSAVFMADAFYNEFWTAPTLGAQSEWVVTYPTKRFYTDPYYIGTTAVPPFQNAFGADAQASAGSCAGFAFAAHDQKASGFTNKRELGMPYLASEPKLCFATQVVTFSQGTMDNPLDHTPNPPSKVLASQLVSANLQSSFENGWAAFEPLGAGLKATNGATLGGQPVTGFWASQLVNGALQGSLANYTVAMRHRSIVTCAKPSATGDSLACQ